MTVMVRGMSIWLAADCRAQGPRAQTCSPPPPLLVMNKRRGDWAATAQSRRQSVREGSWRRKPTWWKQSKAREESESRHHDFSPEAAAPEVYPWGSSYTTKHILCLLMDVWVVLLCFLLLANRRAETDPAYLRTLVFLWAEGSQHEPSL